MISVTGIYNMYVCIHEVMRVIVMKMKMKMKNKSRRYDKNSLDKYTNIVKYRKCLSMMKLLYIKQHLSNIWSSIHEKVK